MFPQIRRLFFDSSYEIPSDDGYRHEVKYTLTPYEYLKFRDFCAGFMDYDKNADVDGEYVVKSFYFDTLNYDDYYEKLSGNYERKKYRLRTYNDSGYYRLEKKMKRGNLNKKLSGEISTEDAKRLLHGDMDIQTGNANTDAIISEMYLNRCRPSNYIEYTRQAFIMKETGLRITFDKEPGVLYGKYNLDEVMPELMPFFYDGSVILEIKYGDFMPGWIEKAVHRLVPSEFSISKYAKALQPVLGG